MLKEIAISARLSYSKLEYSTSFNPQNSNSTKFKPKKTWITRIFQAKTQDTRAKVELDTCTNLTVWNSMKFELDLKWACSSASVYCVVSLKCHFLESGIWLLVYKSSQFTESQLEIPKSYPFCNLVYFLI